MHPPDDDDLTTGAAARRLKISTMSLRRAVARGDIAPARRTPRGDLRFAPAAVDAFAHRLAAADGPRRRPTGIPAPALAARAAGAEEALRASEERYRRIVETAQEGILLLDPAGRITFVNEALADLLGYTVAELVGASAASYVLPEDRDTLRARLAQRRAGLRES